MTRLVMTLEALAIPPSAAKLLRDFIALFHKWNRSINLSAARTEADIEEHVLDSLHVVPAIRGARRVIDVGSGGGFPVVMSAICMPEASFVSLEPVHKKHAFLRTAVRELALPNLDPRAERLEDHPTRDYDAATSRATFDLAEWLALGLQYVRPGGTVVGFEGLAAAVVPNARRLPYALEGKTRALLVATRA
jgi:16S rRNA (guanine527-N7)-methyltransferase